MTRHSLPIVRGRGAAGDLPNRFERMHVELDAEEASSAPLTRSTLHFRDPSRTILTRNRSPDVGFDWSINPYRGCEHGCSYCYARPTHEYLGLSAGLDFESRILVKEAAPRLLRSALSRATWAPTTLVMSGVTDPYQPAERTLRITRGCLEVLREARHPVALITKSRRIEHDVDLLQELARFDATHATLSITTLDRRLQRALEPRASPPEHRLAAVRTLADAGVPVGVNVSPVIPGLTDHEIPAILEAAADAGARTASWVMLRLPGAVEPLFLEWLDTHCPDRAGKVRSRLRSVRGGKLYDAGFGTRMRGEGPFAVQIGDLFRISRKRAGLEGRFPALSADHFRRPARPPSDPDQLQLFRPGPGDGYAADSRR